MKGKGWLAALILVGVLSLSAAAWADAGLTLPQAGLRLYVPEDWQVITADNAAQYAETLAALGTSPEVVTADLAASGAWALMYAPDMEVRFTQLGEAGADSVWTADAAQQDALLALAGKAFPHGQGGWQDDSWMVFESQSSQGGLTVFESAWVTCHYGQLYALEAVRYGQAFTDQQRAELSSLAQGMLVLGEQAQPAVAEKPVYPRVETPTWSGTAEVDVQRDETPVTLTNACTDLYCQTYVLTGQTEPNTSMRYYVNGKGVERFDSDGEGKFSIEIRTLKKGKNTIRVQAVGEKGYGTVTFPLTYHPTQTPVALAEIPKEVAEATYTFVGATAPGAAVTVYIGKEPFRAEMNEDGTFTVTVALDKVKKYNLTLRAEHENYKRQDLRISLTRVKNQADKAADQLKKARDYEYANMLARPAFYKGKTTAPKGSIITMMNTPASGPMVRFQDEAGNVYALACDSLLPYAQGQTGQALIALTGVLSQDNLPMGSLIAFYPSDN